MVENRRIGQSDHWIHAMNTLGAQGVPFLFVLDYDLHRPVIVPLHALTDEIRFHTPAYPSPDRSPGPPIRLHREPIPFETYRSAFDQVMRELYFGNSFLLNLTCSTPITVGLSLEEIFERSRARYKLFFRDQFVLFSPETFIQIREGRINTFPMKGTIDAGIPEAARRILTNEKELAEHITIVDLLRNDLGRVAMDVRVDRFRYIEEVRTQDRVLLQVSSQISGDLSPDYRGRLGEIFSDLLPAGSISGAPKSRTVEILRAAEVHDRGYFTGVFGIFNGSEVDSAVMIRFIEKQGEQLVFKSGGGITTQSDPDDEYREMIDKVYVPIY